MNERIKELAERAEKYADANFKGEHFWTEAYESKFAELIVRECADLFVDRRYMVLNPLQPFADERVRVMKEHDKDTVRTIKRHFGVEE